jgi:HTH-type transcriptional regulator / antitoxin HipB
MTKNPFGYFSPKELGQAIRAERKALGRTQQWVATKCRIRPATVSAIENGKNAELFTVMTILMALGKGLKIVDRHALDPEQLREFFADEDED